MNILALEDGLKSISDQDLAKELRGPTGMVPQFMVLTELNRRRDLRQNFMAAQAQPQSNIAQEFAGATGGTGMAALGMQQPVRPPPPMGQQGPPQGQIPTNMPPNSAPPPANMPQAPQGAPQGMPRSPTNPMVQPGRPPGMADGGEVAGSLPNSMLSDQEIDALNRVYGASRGMQEGGAIEEGRGSRANPDPIPFLDNATLQRLSGHYQDYQPNYRMRDERDVNEELRLRARGSDPTYRMQAEHLRQGGNAPDGPRTYMPDQVMRTAMPYGPNRTNAQIDDVLRVNRATPDERSRVGFPNFQQPPENLRYAEGGEVDPEGPPEVMLRRQDDGRLLSDREYRRAPDWQGVDPSGPPEVTLRYDPSLGRTIGPMESNDRLRAARPENRGLGQFDDQPPPVTESRRTAPPGAYREESRDIERTIPIDAGAPVPHRSWPLGLHSYTTPGLQDAPPDFSRAYRGSTGDPTELPAEVRDRQATARRRARGPDWGDYRREPPPGPAMPTQESHERRYGWEPGRRAYPHYARGGSVRGFADGDIVLPQLSADDVRRWRQSMERSHFFGPDGQIQLDDSGSAPPTDIAMAPDDTPYRPPASRPSRIGGGGRYVPPPDTAMPNRDGPYGVSGPLATLQGRRAGAPFDMPITPGALPDPGVSFGGGGGGAAPGGTSGPVPYAGGGDPGGSWRDAPYGPMAPLETPLSRRQTGSPLGLPQIGRDLPTQPTAGPSGSQYGPRRPHPGTLGRMDIEGAQAEPGAIPFQPFDRDNTRPSPNALDTGGQDAPQRGLDQLLARNRERAPPLRESEGPLAQRDTSLPSGFGDQDPRSQRSTLANMVIDRVTGGNTPLEPEITGQGAPGWDRSPLAHAGRVAVMPEGERLAYEANLNATSTGDPTELPRYAARRPDATPTPAPAAFPTAQPGQTLVPFPTQSNPGLTSSRLSGPGVLDGATPPAGGRVAGSPAASGRAGGSGGGGGGPGGGAGAGGGSGAGGGTTPATLSGGAAAGGPPGESERARNYREMQSLYNTGDDPLASVRTQMQEDRAQLGRDRDHSAGLAMMRAGLGIMASRSPNLGVAVGEGGTAGLDSYMQQREALRRSGREMTGQEAQIAGTTMQDRRAQAQLAETGYQHSQTLAMNREQIASHERIAALQRAQSAAQHRDAVTDDWRRAGLMVDPNTPADQRDAAQRRAFSAIQRGAGGETVEQRREQMIQTAVTQAQNNETSFREAQDTLRRRSPPGSPPPSYGDVMREIRRQVEQGYSGGGGQPGSTPGGTVPFVPATPARP